MLYMLYKINIDFILIYESNYYGNFGKRNYYFVTFHKPSKYYLRTWFYGTENKILVSRQIEK